MPKISCLKDHFFKLLGKQLNEQELEELTFEFGIEAEEYEEQDAETKATLHKISFELAANRPDLLCIENLVHALRMYVGMDQMRKYTFAPPREKIVVKTYTKQIRPYIVGAVLRNVNLDEHSYQSFIDIQDKLHQNYCRKRTLVAIGTHDLDTIKGPFLYDARAPADIKFRALKQTEEMDCVQLFEKLEKDLYLRPYLGIIRDSPVYPVIYDANGVVLSLPPIINGDHSKMSKNTKNIFIESTATDYQRALNSLACLVSGFAQYCQEGFTVEMVEVVYEETNEVKVTPEQTERSVTLSIAYINKLLGINIDTAAACKLLLKMGMISKALNDQQIEVTIPFYRVDVLQECDVAEDIGIAYGFNNIEFKIPESLTVGGENRLNKLSDMVREETAMCGFVECLNFVLCSVYEQSEMINRPVPPLMVSISNSKSAEFQCGRSTLIPGIIKTLKTNAKSKLPIQLFEVADVVIKGQKTEEEGYFEGEGQTGAINRRRLCALHSDNDSSGLDIIHGLLDQLMVKLKVPNQRETGYHIEKSDDPTFFPGLQANILYKNKSIGVMGVVNPKVLKNMDWHFPAALIEIDLQPVFFDFR